MAREMKGLTPTVSREIGVGTGVIGLINGLESRLERDFEALSRWFGDLRTRTARNSRWRWRWRREMETDGEGERKKNKG